MERDLIHCQYLSFVNILSQERDKDEADEGNFWTLTFVTSGSSLSGYTQTLYETQVDWPEENTFSNNCMKVTKWMPQIL